MFKTVGFSVGGLKPNERNNGLKKTTTFLVEAHCLFVGIDGYEDAFGIQEIVGLYMEEDGGLVLYVWADKKQEDWTHRIVLEQCKAGVELCPTNG